jgi:hypothetical protein
VAGRNRTSELDAYDEAGYDPVSDLPVNSFRGREVVECTQVIFFSIVIGRAREMASNDAIGM